LRLVTSARSAELQIAFHGALPGCADPRAKKDARRDVQAEGKLRQSLVKNLPGALAEHTFGDLDAWVYAVPSFSARDWRADRAALDAGLRVEPASKRARVTNVACVRPFAE
jgi:hypothetical protein